MVVNAHDCSFIINWRTNRNWWRFGYCSIYLHLILNEKTKQ